ECTTNFSAVPFQKSGALMKKLLVALSLVLFFAATAAAQTTGPQQAKAVKFGKLWDGKGRLWSNAIVLIENDKITSVTTNASDIPANAQVIDLSHYSGLPGLIDVHTHMTIYTDETPGKPMLKQLADNPPAVEVFLARKGALRTLAAGVTTVRDLG